MFLHPLLECLVEESRKQAFYFEPIFEEACQALHTRKILSSTQKRHHALRIRDLLNEIAYWERRIMAATLHFPILIPKNGSEPELPIVPWGRIEVFLRRLMSEAQETLQIPSVFEPMTLEGILIVIGGFLTFAVAFFLFFRWLKPIRGPVIPFKHEVPITKQARSNFVGIEDSNLEFVEELLSTESFEDRDRKLKHHRPARDPP